LSASFGLYSHSTSVGKLLFDFVAKNDKSVSNNRSNRLLQSKVNAFLLKHGGRANFAYIINATSMWGRFVFLASACALSVTVNDLKCEYLDNPVGLDTLPRFSWNLSADTRGIQQNAYRVLVGEDGKPDGGVWDSGKVLSGKSFNIPYNGPALRSSGVYAWTVQVWANGTQVSPSVPARFVMGLLSPEEWGGKFIGLPSSFSECPWYRKGFQLAPSAKVYSALLYVASLGYHEAYFNGQPVSSAVLSPSVSLLPKRVLYRTYDVTSLVRSGSNAVGLWLGPGWAMFPAYNTSGIHQVQTQRERI